MMASKPSGRRAQIAGTGRRRWFPWILGIALGLVAGGTTAVAYAPPNDDIIRAQAAEWYQHMRSLTPLGTSPAASPTRVGDPQILAASPIGLPPEHTTDQDLVDDDVDELVNVNAPLPDTTRLAAALDEARADLALNHKMLVVDAATGATLYDAGGQDAIVPASTLKLFTAVSALHHLDTDHRFTTSASYEPDRDVTLIGGGDGLLSNGESIEAWHDVTQEMVK